MIIRPKPKAKKKIAPKKPKLNAQTAAQNSLLKDKQRYVKGYLQVVQNLYKRSNFTQEQARIAELAYKRKLPPSGFVALIRAQDPQYVKTQEFKGRHAEASDVWQKFRPGRPMPQEYSARYIRSSMNKMQLIDKVQRSMSAQKAVSAIPQGASNPAAYRQMRALLNGAFQKTVGQDANPLLHKMIFSAQMRDEDLARAIPDLFGGKDVFKWMNQKPDNTGRRATEDIFKASQPQERKSSAPSPFLSQAQNAFGIGVDDLSSGLISSGI